MTILISERGMVEQLLGIDIRWLILPLGIVGIFIVIEVVRIVLRQKKNKGKIDPLDAIEEAIEMDGSLLDEMVSDKEAVFNIEEGAANRAQEGDYLNYTCKPHDYENDTITVKQVDTDKLVVVKSKKEADKTIFTSDIIYVDDNTTVLPKCFESRLKLASDNVKALYSELKNAILSYEGVYSRILRSVEVFRYKGVWARLRIKAKSLYLYLNLSESLCSEELKYKVIENVRGLEGTPIEIKVSGKLKLKRSIALIDKMFINAGIEKSKSYNPIDYAGMYPKLDSAIMDNINVVKKD